MRAFVSSLLVALMLSWPAFAVTPDEVLDDPALEERARDISVNLRCLVCQNQSIDDSDAGLAKDLRVLVRERLVEGDTNSEVIDFVVSRYGEYVLLKPQFSLQNLALWATPVLVFVLGGFAAVNYARSHRRPTTSAALSVEEEQQLAKILDERERN